MFYTIDELADIVGIHRQSIHDQWRRGKGPERVLDRIVRIPRTSAIEWAMERAQNTRSVYKPLYERALTIMRMDALRDNGAYAV